MPLPIFVTSSDGFVAGGQFHRFSGMLLAGGLQSTQPGVEPTRPPAIALVQPVYVVSTLGQSVQVVSTAAASVSAAGYVYIPQTTGPVASSTFALADSAPPLSGGGAALLWDAANRRLMVFSTVHGWVTQLSSVGGGYFTSSNS